MFSPRNVQEQVKERLAMLRDVNEDTIHQAYLAIMFEHLDEARRAVSEVRVLSDQRKAHHPEQGWILVTKEQRDELKLRLFELERMLSR